MDLIMKIIKIIPSPSRVRTDEKPRLMRWLNLMVMYGELALVIVALEMAAHFS